MNAAIDPTIIPTFAPVSSPEEVSCSLDVEVAIAGVSAGL